MKYQVIQNNEKLAFPNEKLVDEVVKKFNTWRFKRSQPSDTELLQKFVQWAIVTGNPIPFVLYWGKGMRAQSGVKERACLDYLLEMGRRIGDVYGPGAHFDILYTDTHATLNGHHPDDIEEYLKCLTVDCGEDFRVWRLSEVVSASKEAVEDVPAIPAEEAEEMIERLVVCAEKWYRGSGRAVDGAARYFRMNMVERIAVERMFSRSIFVTFNGSEMRPIFPEHMPIFYMYSIKKGTSVKPWFMDEPETGLSRAVKPPQAVRA